MKIRMGALAVLVVMVTIVAGCGDGKEPSLLERAMESMGGDDALAKIGSLKLVGAGTYTFGGMEMPYEQTLTYVRPDRLRWVLNSPGFNGLMGLDGETAWSEFMIPVARAQGPLKEGILEWPAHWDMMLVRPLLHREDVEIRPGASAEEVVAVIDGKEWTIGFATNDGETFMSSIKGPQTQEDGRVGELTGTFSEPTAFGDITLPAKAEMVTTVEGKTLHQMQETIKSIEWNPKVEEGFAAMPAMKAPSTEVAVKKLEGFVGLVVVHEGPYDKLSETFGKAFGLAMQTGVMFTPQVTCIYLNDPAKEADPKELRTEVIVPLMVMGEPPKAPEGSEIRHIQNMNVASLTVRGPYGSQEGTTIKKVIDWVIANGKPPIGHPQVVYFHNPMNIVPEDQLSEVQIPVQE